MTALLYAACCIGGWMLIVTWLLLANHRAHSRPKPRPQRPNYPPPVPPYLRREPAPDCRFCIALDDLMALVPVECLSDDEIGLRCADIEAREGWVA